MKQHTLGKKGTEVSPVELIMTVALIAAAALVIGIIVIKTGLLDRGGKAVETTIGGLEDADHDGVKNDVDQCMVAACDPGDRVNEIDRDPNSMYYGCLPTQDVTRSPYADTCNRRGDSTVTSPGYQV